MGRLDAFLESCGENAMDVEMLDGFFTALIAGPELVPPSEYLPEIFGGEVPKFASKEEAGEIMGLLFRHSNAIADTLAKMNRMLRSCLQMKMARCLATPGLRVFCMAWPCGRTPGTDW